MKILDLIDSWWTLVIDVIKRLFNPNLETGAVCDQGAFQPRSWQRNYLRPRGFSTSILVKELSTIKGLFNLNLDEGTICDHDLDEGTICDHNLDEGIICNHNLDEGTVCDLDLDEGTLYDKGTLILTKEMFATTILMKEFSATMILTKELPATKEPWSWQKKCLRPWSWRRNCLWPRSWRRNYLRPRNLDLDERDVYDHGTLILMKGNQRASQPWNRVVTEGSSSRGGLRRSSRRWTQSPNDIRFIFLIFPAKQKEVFFRQSCINLHV